MAPKCSGRNRSFSEQYEFEIIHRLGKEHRNNAGSSGRPYESSHDLNSLRKEDP